MPRRRRARDAEKAGARASAPALAAAAHGPAPAAPYFITALPRTDVPDEFPFESSRLLAAHVDGLDEEGGGGEVRDGGGARKSTAVSEGSSLLGESEEGDVRRTRRRLVWGCLGRPAGD